MKNILFLFIVMVIIPFSLSAQKSITQKQAQAFILQEKTQEAVIAYAQLTTKEPANTTILMEYAYALARGGMFEGTLMHLDRAKLLGAGNEYYFYAAHTLALMGRKDMADAFFETGVNYTPAWLSTANPALPRVSAPVIINSDSDDSTYERANTLAAKGMFLQSLVLLQELTDKYPDVYFPYLSGSIIFENLNLHGKAAELLEKSIARMNETLKHSEDAELKADLTDALPAFTSHLDRLMRQTPVQGKQSIFRKLREKYNPKTMLYIGGMYSNSFFSFNSRFGVFIADSWNAAADLGISGGSGATYVNLGLSVYERWKFLVGGIGLSGQFGKSTSLNVRFTSGLSFFNKKKNRSTDIFLTTDVPLRKDAKTTYGISIGRSFYFGKRKEK
ncbi:MAG: DUF4142 domain-containing protein [Prevotellaceae bacterium]|jgi:tetratricopeptide (TPR) repeat protein|nr:DUF4142 domain-containing protein [Prevotellaceae bacterium]